MKLNEIIDTDMLANEIHAGYVTERFHPEFPELAILNYTDRCQFDQHWTDVTRRTRGLIYNRVTGEVIARPFAKFYNYGDTTNTGDLSPDAPILSAHNKWDGSLGIRYRQPDGRYAIATRGSFTSDQAIHATALLHAQPEGFPIPIDGQTDMFEIIFPGNRIVLDYGDMDALMFLGAVDHASGDFYPVRRRDEPKVKTLREIIELPNRENAEGWVVWLDPQRAVKFKQDDYLALHRIVSSLSTKEVWRQLRAGTFEEFAVSLPDEFHQWALETAEPLLAQHAWTVDGANRWLAAVHARGFETRKDQALYITREVLPETRGLVFSLLDGKDITDAVWRTVEPMGADTSQGATGE